MRTAQLIVSGAAFAVWLAASVALYVLCDTSWMLTWWVVVPAAVMPPFWCIVAWFASRRADPDTLKRLTMLAVPVLMCGVWAAAVVAEDIAQRSSDWLDPEPPRGLSHAGMCGWPVAASCGLISFIGAVRIQIKAHFQPPEETLTNPETEARP